MNQLRAENRFKSATEISTLIPNEAKPYAFFVGAWLWIEFPEKPSHETRKALIDLGFAWNSKRGAWQHCGGHPTRYNAKADPKYCYGVVPIGDEVAA
jgi:hypothetical protein